MSFIVHCHCRCILFRSLTQLIFNTAWCVPCRLKESTSTASPLSNSPCCNHSLDLQSTLAFREDAILRFLGPGGRPNPVHQHSCEPCEAWKPCSIHSHGFATPVHRPNVKHLRRCDLSCSMPHGDPSPPIHPPVVRDVLHHYRRRSGCHHQYHRHGVWGFQVSDTLFPKPEPRTGDSEHAVCAVQPSVRHLSSAGSCRAIRSQRRFGRIDWE